MEGVYGKVNKIYESLLEQSPKIFQENNLKFV
jgi:hypothetical protein